MTSENLYAFFGFFSGSCRQVLTLVGVVLGVESVATKQRLDVAAILLLFSSMGSLLVAYFYGPRHLSLKLHNVEFHINVPLHTGQLITNWAKKGKKEKLRFKKVAVRFVLFFAEKYNQQIPSYLPKWQKVAAKNWLTCL